MSQLERKPKTEGITPVKCLWSGGGFALWKMRDGESDFYRLSMAARWVGDYATEHEATNELAKLT